MSYPYMRKLGTGLTGMMREEHPHRRLTILYDKIIKNLLKIPTDSVYRQHAEPMYREKLALVKSVEDVRKLEEQLGDMHIEESLESAERELNLCRNMIKWKAWEPLIGEAPKNQWTWPPN
ncbi:putative NADH dehydrogenase [ubiquinone] 1 alpha subcomplex subunit 5 [Crassostrea virginica]|uniref:Probable NADH dehydrogenase [ubiquinone] 1 alpha subcomplex subunit 5 n=1 Tax=Crassostrea virginica TaxID=6565 RepID=A0A8B8DIH4_CRAVI|nr:probable NADH dehydrogenase [ubiquinone] 1 alpha subcomplex subunit 5 [Crassostrea virginica]XP_022327654.1 probable NADH dehydrogenase [ubiquinone] 1 alpha subcomplex subunit 5 [Crassostrea virginica]|mmetsp:Transcript_837/g.920  ORF Transcript_837/g.920 Transcript_837/m.920 type:complete len:120 (-) Transcript_837:53-412(-)